MGSKYLLDGEIVTWEKLINAAENISDGFDRQSIKTTSEAAAILRASRHEVEEIKRIRS